MQHDASRLVPHARGKAGKFYDPRTRRVYDISAAILNGDRFAVQDSADPNIPEHIRVSLSSEQKVMLDDGGWHAISISLEGNQFTVGVDDCWNKYTCIESQRTQPAVEPEPVRPAPPPERNHYVSQLAWRYCEKAPPREVVESTRVTLDALEAGLPVEVPLVFSAAMKLEYERHERAWKARGLKFHPEREVQPPEGTDMFGGAVDRGKIRDEPEFPVRCAVCGAWMRMKYCSGALK